MLCRFRALPAGSSQAATGRRGPSAPQPVRCIRSSSTTSSGRRLALAAAGNGDAAASKEAQLEDMVERFMREQAEKESGAAFARTSAPEQVIGADAVPDEEAKAYCRAIVGFLRTLKANRDMSPNEARLVVAIEDPADRERRKLGIEDERGVSRDEMAAALDDVSSGRIPRDRLALRCLYEEMASWPDLELEPSEAAAN